MLNFKFCFFIGALGWEVLNFNLFTGSLGLEFHWGFVGALGVLMCVHFVCFCVYIVCLCLYTMCVFVGDII